MIHLAQLEKELTLAEISIRASGQRVTVYRQKMLGVLACSPKPLSAYELTELFNQTYNEHLIANSVYRILNDLICARLAHRLNTINKYVGCLRQHNQPINSFPLFIICDQCLHVEQEPAPDALIQAAVRKVDNAIFDQINAQVELTGLCTQCREGTTSKREHHA